MNNVLTASRMNCLLRCPRASFWQHEVGLRKDAAGLALRLGSAWARAMEARWNGANYEAALACAIPEGVELDDYACATVSALLAGYYDYYGKREKAGKIHPEVQFRSNIEGTDFTAEGKMDGLGSLKDGRSVLIEAKTTGYSIAPDSDYWLRLRFNVQVLQYVTEARKLGWDLSEVFYDVTRKPSIRPKSVYDTDKAGRKIVIDNAGRRIYCQKKVTSTASKAARIIKVHKIVDDLEKPRQSGDESKGWKLKQHIETPDEYCDRLWKDTLARPDFYFARREVPIIDQELESFERLRKSLAKVIEHYREHENRLGDEPCDRDPEAWPRAVSEQNCKFCSYATFCLQNISVDINSPPAGFAVMPFNPELNDNDTSTTEGESSDASSTSQPG